MINTLKKITGISIVLLSAMGFSIRVDAAPTSTIESGIYVDDIDLSGMSSEQATQAVNNRVAERSNAVITLTDGADYRVSFSGADIGYAWKNPQVINEAASLGKKGNIVERFD